MLMLRCFDQQLAEDYADPFPCKLRQDARSSISTQTELALQITSPAVPHLNAVGWLEPAKPILTPVEVHELNLQITSPAVPHLNAVGWLEPTTPILTPVDVHEPNLQTLPAPTVDPLQIVESETPLPCSSNLPSRRKRSYSEMMSDAPLSDRNVPRTRMGFSELLPYEEVEEFETVRGMLECDESESEDPFPNTSDLWSKSDELLLSYDSLSDDCWAPLGSPRTVAEPAIGTRVEVHEPKLQITSPAVPHLNAVGWLEPATPMLTPKEVHEPNLQITSPAVPHLNAVGWLEPATPILTPVEVHEPNLQTLPTPTVDPLQIVESETPLPCSSNLLSRRKRSYSEMMSDAPLPDRNVPKTRMRYNELLPYEEVVALNGILEGDDSEDPFPSSSDIWSESYHWSPVVAQQPAIGRTFIPLNLEDLVVTPPILTHAEVPEPNLQITSPAVPPADTSNLPFLDDDVEVWDPPLGPRLNTQYFQTQWGFSVHLNDNLEQWRDASTKVFFEDDDAYNEKQIRMTPFKMDRPVSEGLFDVTQRSPIRTESVPLIDDAFFCWSNRCPPEAGIFWSALRGSGYKGEPLINSHQEDDGWAARMKPVLEAQEKRVALETERLQTELVPEKDLTTEDIQRTFEANLNLAKQRPRTL
ncbi:MAG: uncharacterized protein KVP18_000886 [Porospora cf. gigantea A]|nr:MAG: hypothetical protein KVP18_000886 [Porospora cf. gigantea A]